MFHCTYQAVRKSIDAYVMPIRGSVIEVQLPFPIHSDQEIIEEFKKGLKRGKVNGGRVRLEIIDNITSMPSVVILVQEFIRDCREEEVDQIFIDCAHAIGSLRVDVKETGADFYESWGTILSSPPKVCVGMIMVGLPPKLFVTSVGDALRWRFYQAIEVLVYYQALRNAERDPRDKDGFITGYVRISHQVYNTVDDYHRLKTAIVQILENKKFCSELPKE